MKNGNALFSVAQAQAYQQYLDDNYLSYLQTHVGQQFIKPDHLRYIEEGKASLSPAAQALNKKISATNNTQSFVNLLLSWVQSIPYNTLQDRQTTNGAGYLPPSLVLSNNQGDCDSKSVLAASLIRSVLPEVKMVMLYLPKHALLGININNNRRGRRLDIEGINYTLMEPTGPAELKLGNIARSSEQAIASKKYSYEIIP
ncbi:hypothetical protein RS130_00975 [Paraglaciecola aquimarina]|uniref:Transglutaminase-like domain-containing protein n=1 Tax=Paraglaciecola aquimarina TaxID=1235557 RepID=A0ABU3SRP2_9ALTE|nr:hypothetical protein [Paraglaciecola aquimarina]MDU0352673.1 hypothetical protein [Paraglaciecola aquimarina]